MKERFIQTHSSVLLCGRGIGTFSGSHCALYAHRPFRMCLPFSPLCWPTVLVRDQRLQHWVPEPSCNNHHRCSDCNTTGIQLLTVPQAGSLKFRASAGLCSVSGLLLPLPACGSPSIPWLVATSLQSRPPIFTWMSPEPPLYLSPESGPPLTEDGLHLNP